MMDGLGEFLDLFMNKDDEPLRIRFGTVTGVTVAGKVPVTVGAGATVVALRYIASYNPVNGDTVVIIANGQDMFVLGKLT